MCCLYDRNSEWVMLPFLFMIDFYAGVICIYDTYSKNFWVVFVWLHIPPVNIHNNSRIYYNILFLFPCFKPSIAGAQRLSISEFFYTLANDKRNSKKSSFTGVSICNLSIPYTCWMIFPHINAYLPHTLILHPSISACQMYTFFITIAIFGFYALSTISFSHFVISMTEESQHWRNALTGM